MHSATLIPDTTVGIRAARGESNYAAPHLSRDRLWRSSIYWSDAPSAMLPGLYCLPSHRLHGSDTIATFPAALDARPFLCVVLTAGSKALRNSRIRARPAAAAAVDDMRNGNGVGLREDNSFIS